MSTPLAEQPNFDNYSERHLWVVPNPPEDEVLAGLQAFLHTIISKDTPALQGYEAITEKDYRGSASKKIQVGGRMIVSLYFEGDDPLKLVVDRDNRPFNNDLCTELGRIAEANFRNGKGVIRDLL